MNSKIPRRKFILGASAFSGALLAHKLSLPVSAQVSQPTLDIYTIMWRSVGGKIPWNSSNPREVAEGGAFVIWAYVQQEIYRRGGLILLSLFSSTALTELLISIYNKGSIIGHAALFVKYRDPNGSSEQIVFSNSGSNVGMYARWYDEFNNSIDITQVHPKFPKREPYQNGFPRIMGCCYLLETVAGHLKGGFFETGNQFISRIKKHEKPRVRKNTLLGAEAKNTFALFREIENQTNSSNGPGAPGDYGLNITAVRQVGSEVSYPPRANLATSQPMKNYLIGGEQHPIHGGCANTVASVLQAAGLGNLVEESARFKIELSFENFKDAAIPILVGPSAFDPQTGRAVDVDMRRELGRLPQTWGSGDTVEFYDPNYWYDSLPVDDRDFNSLIQSI